MAGNKGLVVAFSGLDGAGKSTQISLLEENLQKAGFRPRYLWTRGGYTPGFEWLKFLLRRVKGDLPPPGSNPKRTEAFRRSWVRRAWLLIAMLDLLWVYGVQLRWWRRQGYIVLCDRYLLDTAVDFHLQLSQENWEDWSLWRLLRLLSPEPDTAFFMVLPVADSVRRSDIKGEPFRESASLLVQRWSQYQTLLSAGGWHVLNGSRPRSELAAEIWAILVPKLPKKKSERWYHAPESAG